MTEEQRKWGVQPWRVDFEPEVHSVPPRADIVIVGGGFTGLAAAARLRRLAAEKTVVVLEARQLGAGASGRSGGIVLPETAAGNLPGLGNVVEGFTQILHQLGVCCDLALTGAWEIGRGNFRRDSPITWHDNGVLGVVKDLPGGTLDPGKLVAGLTRASCSAGVLLFEHTPVLDVEFGRPLRFVLPTGELAAERALFATNAAALELTCLAQLAQPMLTLALQTEPLRPEQLEAIGLSSRKPFYTVDLPYLWGRVMPDGGLVFGSGRVAVSSWRDLDGIDVHAGVAALLYAALEKRVRKLHPALANVEFVRRWGGPTLFTRDWRPAFSRHPRSPDALVLGAYSGHGVALSVYLGYWAAEVLLDRKELPPWGEIAG